MANGPAHKGQRRRVLALMGIVYGEISGVSATTEAPGLRSPTTSTYSLKKKHCLVLIFRYNAIEDGHKPLCRAATGQFSFQIFDVDSCICICDTYLTGLDAPNITFV